MAKLSADDCKADVLETVKTVDMAEINQGTTEDGYFFIGSADAPVVMEEFTDYQCPYCQQYFFKTFQKIVDNYIAAGEVKYVFRDKPLPGHSRAAQASEATRCAGEQGQYFEMHKKLFTAQGEWSYTGDLDATLVSYATELGLDGDEFGTCIADTKYDTAIAKSVEDAEKIGISGTPSFTINGNVAVGALPYDSFKQAIEHFLGGNE